MSSLARLLLGTTVSAATPASRLINRDSNSTGNRMRYRLTLEDLIAIISLYCAMEPSENRLLSSMEIGKVSIIIYGI
jgi:hypothetical protein